MNPERLFERPLVVVSGKGGTGKSTIAAALALVGAARGRSVLLAEVEGRGEIARTLGVPDPGYVEEPTPMGFRAISITPRAAVLEYLHLFVGFDRATRALLRRGLVEHIIEAAPGFRDLLICGKLYEIVGLRRGDDRLRTRPRYDLVVVDGPPTGQIAAFLAAPAAFAELVRMGRVRRQAAGIDRLFRRHAHAVVTSLAEEMSVAETLEAIPAIEAAGVPVAAVVVNRLIPDGLPQDMRRASAGLSAPDVVRTLGAAGADVTEAWADALLAATAARDRRRRRQRRQAARLRRVGPLVEVPEIFGQGGPDLVREVAVAIDPSAGGGGPVAAPRRRDLSSRLPPARADLAPHLNGARVVIVCGSGGVGKTTTSAAIAVHLADGGRRAVLLTVDPARRLATALHLPMVPGERTNVPVDRGRHLEAIQLDTQRTFDELVRRYASPDRRDRILANTFYRRISDTLAGTHEYMAMEKLYELAAEEGHDTIVIDTPPTRSALSFLDAPKRLTDFLGGRFLRLLLWPTARAGRLTFGLARLGAEAFGRTVGRLVGAETLGDVAEFLGAFEGMYGGFSARAGEVLELLRSPRCAFVVVTEAARPSMEEASFFVSRLRGSGMRAAAVVVNRWHPEGTEIPDGAEAAVVRMAEGSLEERALAGMLADRLRRESARLAEADAMSRFIQRNPGIPVIAVPELEDDVHDVPGLRRMGGHLFSS